MRKQAMEVMQDLAEMRECSQDAAGDELGQWRETDTECCEQGPHIKFDMKRTARHLIQKLPIKSVLIAAGAGVLLGAFWTIRSR